MKTTSRVSRKSRRSRDSGESNSRKMIQSILRESVDKVDQLILLWKDLDLPFPVGKILDTLKTDVPKEFELHSFDGLINMIIQSMFYVVLKTQPEIELSTDLSKFEFPRLNWCIDQLIKCSRLCRISTFNRALLYVDDVGADGTNVYSNIVEMVERLMSHMAKNYLINDETLSIMNSSSYFDTSFSKLSKLEGSDAESVILDYLYIPSKKVEGKTFFELKETYAKYGVSQKTKIIDAGNVLFYGNKEGVMLTALSYMSLLQVVKSFKDSEDCRDVIVVMDRSRFYNTFTDLPTLDKRTITNIILELKKISRVVLTKGIDDDKVALSLSYEYNIPVVTKDNFSIHIHNIEVMLRKRRFTKEEVRYYIMLLKSKLCTEDYTVKMLY